jgi:hypothetical protein
MDNSTGSLDYIRRMERIENNGYINSMSGVYGKPLGRFELFKRKIMNFLRRIKWK